MKIHASPKALRRAPAAPGTDWAALLTVGDAPESGFETLAQIVAAAPGCSKTAVANRLQKLVLDGKLEKRMFCNCHGRAVPHYRPKTK